MKSPNLPPEPSAERPTLEGRRLGEAVMGVTGFRIELGPNADSPEAPVDSPEVAAERDTPEGHIGRSLTDSEAGYVTDVLGTTPPEATA